MPTYTERQQASDMLRQLFLLQFVAEMEAKEDEYNSDGVLDSGSDESMDSDSSSNSSDSFNLDSSSSSSSSSSESDSGMADALDFYVEAMAMLYADRYVEDRQKIPKTQDQMELLLGDYKTNHPHIFRSYLRITPGCFDDLVNTIADDDVFHNNSNNPQAPVSHQLVVALYCFGHYGNAASTDKVALHFGIGHGTVHLYTRRVIKACCSAQFRQASVHWPGPDEKEAAKAWVELQSCPTWRDGWLMVDGTLVPLFCRPGDYGNSFWDRKQEYSLNVQLVSTPDCQIVDYAIGLPGSQHDATAWQDTYIWQHHDMLFSDAEWIWGDSAYPLKEWCQAPYKK
ncbi:hypothetical protein BDN72DRAFT_780670 [Pluteus cervinus]|uniref:Uncharacterized protein n=1 Tax=Pluteus cervinus TaxID=181527 RepID=A0ACD3A262_9AGAR|nr:hypothetical protein BDN72DRAFT_780670 [Pluteus cervinus]